MSSTDSSRAARGLRALREQAGFRSARDMAFQLGVPAATYSRWEREPGRMPLRAAARVADFLGSTVDSVVGRPAPAPDPASIQARFDALDAESQRLIDAAVDLLARDRKGA